MEKNGSSASTSGEDRPPTPRLQNAVIDSARRKQRSAVEATENRVGSRDDHFKLPRLPRGPRSVADLRRKNVVAETPRTGDRPPPLTHRPMQPSRFDPHSAHDSALDSEDDEIPAERLIKPIKDKQPFKFPKLPTLPKLPSGLRKLKTMSFKFGNKKDKTKLMVDFQLLGKDRIKECKKLSSKTRQQVADTDIVFKTVIAKNDPDTRALLIVVTDALLATAKKSLREENVEAFYALLAYDDYKRKKSGDLRSVLKSLEQACRNPGDDELGRAQINLTHRAWACVLGENSKPDRGISPFVAKWKDSSDSKLKSALDDFVAIVNNEVAVYMQDIWAEFCDAVATVDD